MKVLVCAECIKAAIHPPRKQLPIPSVEITIKSYTSAFNGSSDSDDNMFSPNSDLPSSEKEDDECITTYSEEGFILSTPRIEHSRTNVQVLAMQETALIKTSNQVPVSVEAKVIKCSEGDLLEMVPEGGVKRPNKEAGTGFSSFTILKKTRVESAPSAKSLAKEKMNDKTNSLDQIDLDVDSARLVPFQPSIFEAPQKRIAQQNDDQSVQSMLKLRPDPCKSQLPPSKCSRTLQPRSSAIPLDDQRHLNSIPPAITPKECRASGGPVASKLSEAVSTRGDSLEANSNDNEQSLIGVVPSVISEGTSNPKSEVLVHRGQMNRRKNTEVAAVMRKEEIANLITSSNDNNNTDDACNQLVPSNASLPTPQVARTSATSQDPLGRFLPIDENMLARVCNWNYTWIAEQKNPNELPQILDSVFTLPKLIPERVLMAYNSITQYEEVFFPFMLHEIWGHIYKDFDNTAGVWRAKAILRENVSSDDVSAFVQCEALVPEASSCLQEYDLVVLSFAKNKEETREVFGVVKSVSLRNYDGYKMIDERLHPSCPEPCVRVSFTLRMKPSNVPEGRSQILVEIRRVTSLKTHVKQLSMFAELPNSPLYDVIMDPIRNSEAFMLIQEASPVAQSTEVSCMDNLLNNMTQLEQQLNESKKKLVTSISETVIKTGKDVPKVAMLQGPPGTGKSHMIVPLVLRLLFQHYAEKKFLPRILVCAPSNTATDKIALRLINTDIYKQNRISVVRVGDLSAINPDLKEIAVETLARAEHERLRANCTSDDTLSNESAKKGLEQLKKLKDDLRLTLSDTIEKGDHHYAKFLTRKIQDIEEMIKNSEEDEQRLKREFGRLFHNELSSAKEAIIEQANVICTTLNSCRDTDMENVFLRSKGGNRNSDILCCIIDNASQCTEPESLTPLGLGISKLVLIGDTEQLQATVYSQFALKFGFDQSLFNRFSLARCLADFTHINPEKMLNTQYRMRSTMCTWP